MKAKISNITELRQEIARLNQLKKEQEDYLSEQYQLLKHKVEAPARFVGAVTSSIPGVDFMKGVFSAFGGGAKSGTTSQTDWLGRAVQLGLPLVLNRTFLRHSSWFKKALVLLASETAAGQITQDKVGSVLSKITDFVRPKKKSKKKHRDIAPLADLGQQDGFNYGVTPDSETN